MKPDVQKLRRQNAVEFAMSGKYKQYEFYEDRFTDQFVRAVPGKVVIDCGMCYGYYTALALWAGCKGVVGFEPNDALHGAHLREYFGDRADVVLHFSALTDKVGELKLFSRPGTLRSWSATPKIALQRGNQNKRKLEPVSVPCTTIDQAVSGPVGVIKCDTEGGEATIFHGARKTLEKYHPAIFLELHRISTKAKVELQELLRSYGYPADFVGAKENRHVLEAR